MLKILHLTFSLFLILPATLFACDPMHPEMPGSTSAVTKSTAVKPDIKPISLEERLVTVREYYGKNLFNPDRGIFKHYRQWYMVDVTAVRSRLQSPERMKILEESNSAVLGHFSKNSINYGHIGLVYWIYSKLLGDNFEEEQEDISKALKALQGDDLKSECGDTGGGVLRFVSHGLRVLPFATLDGIASFRGLNESYGLLTPAIGLPLSNSNYDGYMDEDPDAFYTHDGPYNHLIFEYTGHNSQLTLTDMYKIYALLNDIVYGIKDKPSQFQCDVFLFEFGHEGAPGIVLDTIFNGVWEKYTCVPVKPDTLRFACDKVVKGIEEELEELNREYEVDCVWDRLISWEPFSKLPGIASTESEQTRSMFKECYYKSRSLLRLFINPETQKLFSVQGFINYNKLDKSKQFSLRNLMTETFPAVLYPNEDSIEFRELFQYAYSGGAKFPLPTYNKLLELEKYFNDLGIAFKVWDGDIINIAGLVSFYRDLSETFIRLVGSEFEKRYSEVE